MTLLARAVLWRRSDGLPDMQVPGHADAPQIRAPAAALLFVAFLVGALGEELGWSGYITDPMQQQWNALQTGLLLGLVAVLWHLPPLLLMHRSPSWIAWWCLYAVAARILIVWLFNNTGKSVFAVALFHATLNLSHMLFPVNGSHFDIRLSGVTMVLAAACVIAVWRPVTLARGLHCKTHGRSEQSC
jgi:membrane protease YdiL (CAAX protease family)